MRLIPVVSSALTGLIVGGLVALAAAPGVIQSYNAICDVGFPTRCLGIAPDGSIAVTGGGGGSGGGGATLKSTAADPTYVEGSTTDPLSGDLSGHLRVLAKQQTSPWVVGGTVGISGGVGVTQVTSPWTITGPVTHAAGSAVDGWDITQGAKTDARGTATDGTPLSVIAILKQLSFLMQNPVTQPVSGTVGISGGVAATQSGAWNVGQVGSPWGVAGTGSAGAAASGVITVQGIAGGVAQQVAQTGSPWGVTGTGTAGVAATGVVSVQGIAGGVAQPISGSVGITGTAAVTQSGTWTVQQGTPPWTVTPGVQTSGIPLAGSGVLSSAFAIKASAGVLYGISISTTSTGGYLVLVNAAASPGAGAIVPVASCYVPAFGTCGLQYTPPASFSLGIQAVFTTAATPYTYTPSATAQFSSQAF
jgi:hypothetical protein